MVIDKSFIRSNLQKMLIRKKAASLALIELEMDLFTCDHKCDPGGPHTCASAQRKSSRSNRSGAGDEQEYHAVVAEAAGDDEEVPDGVKMQVSEVEDQERSAGGVKEPSDQYPPQDCR